MRSIVCIFVMLFTTSGLTQDFSPFQQILNKHLVVNSVAGGGLETAFKYDEAHGDKETQALIKKQVVILKQFDPETLTKKNKALSFWINAYNFSMIRILLEKGYSGNKRTVNSVKDFGSFFNPYFIFKDDIIYIGKKKLSLDKIEKGILLGDSYLKKGWKDARIHFAVNCASVGCPPLRKAIYQADSIEKVLDDNVSKALKTSRHLSVKGKTLKLTHLFKWYEKDFQEAAGSVRSFIKRYVKDSIQLQSINDAKNIDYIDYDWSLNSPQNFKQSK